jgi:hypothetical protein
MSPGGNCMRSFALCYFYHPETKHWGDTAPDSKKNSKKIKISHTFLLAAFYLSSSSIPIRMLIKRREETRRKVEEKKTEEKKQTKTKRRKQDEKMRR